MSERVRELEAQFRLVQEYHRQIYEDKNIQGSLSKAVEWHGQRIQKRWFSRFRRSIVNMKRVKAHIRFKELRRSRFLKMLTFLYLK